jgi:hypothetical protein
VKLLKFKLTKGKGSVNRFVDANSTVHRPGDIVDLPASFKGEKWLEPINKTVPKPMVPVDEKAVEVPLPKKTTKKQKKKKS